MGSKTNHTSKGPGRAERKGLSLIDLLEMFPDDATAERWFTEGRWPDGVRCAHCNGHRVARSTHETMPYHCRDCRRFFSVRNGTVMQSSKIGYQKWAIAVYLMATGLKGTSSMYLHRALNISQKTAWHMAMRIRAIWEQGRGTVGKTAVAATRDRESGEISAAVVPDTTAVELKAFVRDRVSPEADIFTDDLQSYRGLRNHATVRHSIGEYVDQQAHVNGVESFWSMLKRGYHGTFHRISRRTCSATSTSSPAATTSGPWTRNSRCAQWPSGWSVSNSATRM